MVRWGRRLRRAACSLLLLVLFLGIWEERERRMCGEGRERRRRGKVRYGDEEVTERMMGRRERVAKLCRAMGGGEEGGCRYWVGQRYHT